MSGWPTIKAGTCSDENQGCFCECPADANCTIAGHIIDLASQDEHLGKIKAFESQADKEHRQMIVVVDLGETDASNAGPVQVGQSVTRVRYRGSKSEVADMAKRFRKLLIDEEFCVSTFGWVCVRRVIRGGLNKLNQACWEIVDNFQMRTIDRF